MFPLLRDMRTGVKDRTMCQRSLELIECKSAVYCIIQQYTRSTQILDTWHMLTVHGSLTCRTLDILHSCAIKRPKAEPCTSICPQQLLKLVAKCYDSCGADYVGVYREEKSLDVLGQNSKETKMIAV